ncbi:hypothetical protein ATO13_15644 [Stappia sp. 22II-S9-Z10]|nr:hypothetical protein ATO13_15644 [Stappia sp. 22II-S9-Z10]
MQHLHDGKARVEADEVGKLQRPHLVVGAEPHPGVDRLHRADALVQRIDRLVDHRQEDAVDDEGGKILRRRRHLAETRHEAGGELEGLVRRRNAAHQLHELHHRDGVHEMDADEPFRPVRRRGEAGDGDRRGVGGEHRFGLQERADLRIDLALHLLVLGHRLDDEVDVRQLVEIFGRVDLVDRGFAVGILDPAGGDLTGHVAGNRGEAGLDPLAGHIVQIHVVAREGRDVRDSVAHLTGADDADASHFVHERRR